MKATTRPIYIQPYKFKFRAEKMAKGNLNNHIAAL